MKNPIKKISILFVALFALACGDNNSDMPSDNEQLQTTGTLAIKVTDAPIDNSEVEACFVTISEVKVDGQKVEGFNKTTVDVLAYQKGETYLLGDYNLEAKAYSEVELILDHTSDASGQNPGCYIMTSDGEIHSLASSDVSVTIDGAFEVEEDTHSDIVIDFDLRKCIKSNESAGSRYSFVTKAEMESGIRLSSSSSATITGNCDELLFGSDKVIVYAYAKGTYNKDTEIQGSAQSRVVFHNAANSAACDSNGNFEMHFLNEGDYELHFMSYEQNAKGEFILKGELVVDVLNGLDLLNLSLTSESTVNINVIATGIIDF